MEYNLEDHSGNCKIGIAYSRKSYVPNVADKYDNCTIYNQKNHVQPCKLGHKNKELSNNIMPKSRF